MILRLLNIQGIVGLAASLGLAVLLIVQKGETHHWKKQSASFERLYRQEQSAFAGTVANYRAAADAARSMDKANAIRVADAQRAINERTSHDFESRLAAARAHAGELRFRSQAATDPRPGRSSSMPGLSASTPIITETTVQDGFPRSDALTATEQAIQLDELIKWVRQRAEVDNRPPAVASPQDSQTPLGGMRE